MLAGLAKKQFYEDYQRRPWASRPQSDFQFFPLLDSLLTKEKLSYLDYALAQRLLREYPQANEAMAFFLCHLSLAAKEGHLCVRLGETCLEPQASQLWQKDGDLLSDSELNEIDQLIYQGARQLPSYLISDVNINLLTWPSTPLCRYGSLIYFQRHWVFETLFLNSFQKQSLLKPQINLNQEKISQTVSHLCRQGTLLQEQAEAILKGCENGFSIITGGPGTGKTYTAGQFIKVFWQQLSDEQKQHCEIALAAPTGKAAANLQSSLRKAVQGLVDFPPLAAKTLHHLLGIKKADFNLEERSKILSADLLIVDESSMIDVKLMARLFQSIKEGARLILLGDQHQLPSVEAGSLFADLVNLHRKSNVPCTKLKTCLRAELQSIIELAQAVNRGEADLALSLMDGQKAGIRRLNYSIETKDGQQAFIKHILQFFPSLVDPKMSEEQILNLFNVRRVLSPMRKGILGVDSLNQTVWSQLSQSTPFHGWLAVPILITANDYRQDLFNGETGVLMRKLPLNPQNRLSLKLEDHALFMAREGTAESKVRKIPALLLPKYEYAYCLSVHKSQGSEFDDVILVLPEGSEDFGREIFYTALTRAKKQIEICGADAVIRKTICQQRHRLSGICARIDSPIKE